MDRTIDRKEFLKNSLILTAGISLFSCEPNSLEAISPNEEGFLNFPKTNSPQEIVIIGGGISGLVAAYELTNIGHKVTILEARNRVGGRVKTLRSNFLEENFAEAGASRIPPDHNYTMHYISRFNLELENFYPREGNYFFLDGSTRSLISNTSFLANRPWEGSVTHSEYKKIKHGTDQLPLAFANHLLEKLHLSKPVVSIDQTADRILIKTQSNEQFEADKVICTVPLPVLNNIRFLPQLSEKKQRVANGEYNYSPSSRFFIETKERFWKNLNINGWGNSDLPEEVWQPTWDRSNNKGILLSYLKYSTAHNFDNKSNIEQEGSLLNRWRYIFPDIDKYILSTQTHSWKKEEWSNGAWASPTASQEKIYGEDIASREGNIYFAGEHASNYHGWMQGAFESGLRVVSQISMLG